MAELGGPGHGPYGLALRGRRPRRRRWYLPPFHPLLGTPLYFLLAGGAAMLLAASLAVLLLRVEAVAPASLGPLFDSRILLGAVTMWLPLCVATLLFGRWVTRLSLTDMGLIGRRPWRDVGLGFLVGGGMIAAPALLGRLLGGYQPGEAGDGLVALLVTVAALALSAFGEELVGRGFLLRYWQRRHGAPLAILVTSLLFTAAHLGNSNVSWLGLAGIFIAGVLLALVFLYSGDLWLVTGLHLGWNTMTAVILGLPVSGNRLPSLLDWQPVPGDPWDLLLGGAFGPEEGLLFHLAATAAAVAFWRLLRNRTDGVSAG